MITPQEATEFIKRSQNVAVVGLSPHQDRPSYQVASFLQQQGLKIIPVNPFGEETLGEPIHSSLNQLEPGTVDWIDFFVHALRLPSFTQEVIRLKPKLVWCQLTVVDLQFAKEIEAAGIPVLMDYCPKIEWYQY